MVNKVINKRSYSYTEEQMFYRNNMLPAIERIVLAHLVPQEVEKATIEEIGYLLILSDWSNSVDPEFRTDLINTRESVANTFKKAVISAFLLNEQCRSKSFKEVIRIANGLAIPATKFYMVYPKLNNYNTMVQACQYFLKDKKIIWKVHQGYKEIKVEDDGTYKEGERIRIVDSMTTKEKVKKKIKDFF